jgi:hypothetical protein
MNVQQMDRKEVIVEVSKCFKITELVCKHTYDLWKEKSWNFLDTDYLRTILVLRMQIIKVPMTCNTPTQNQRGIRCNLCALVQAKTDKGNVYLTQHGFGKGGDFSTVNNVIPASGMRSLIKANKNLLPCKVRIEKDVNWLHIDVMELVTDEIVTEF